MPGNAAPAASADAGAAGIGKSAASKPPAEERATPSPPLPAPASQPLAAPAPAKSAAPARAEPKAAPTANGTPIIAKASPAAAHEGFAVQLAAFADDKGANALAGSLKKAGYAAYTEPLKTSKGTLWRVRVGPYPSREAAVAARDKLKSEGQSGIVAAVD